MTPRPEPPPRVPSTRFAQLRALGAAAPRRRVGFAWPRPPDDGLREVLPLPRSPLAIGVAAALFAVMCIPLVALGLPSLSTDGGLFGFSISLFQCLWLLGWSVGAALPGLALAVLLLGREVVIARPDVLRLRLEVLGFGLGAEYAANDVANLRQASANGDGADAWRGAHLLFDYHAVPVAFGSRLEPAAASQLCLALQQVLSRAAPSALATRASAVASPPTVIASTPGVDDLAPTSTGAATSTAASRLAVLGLIGANLLPLLGVLLFGWRVGEIMLVYWAESVIIGLINVAKLVVIGRWAAAFYAPFFLGHYGAFMAGHLLFVYMFFMRDAQHAGDIEVSDVVASLAALWPALLGLTLSHLLSFVQNFLARREYQRITIDAQMNAPYKRVFVMQFTIIIGGMLTVALGSSVPALGLLIALKLLIDVNAHHGERRRAGVDADVQA